MSTGNLIEIKIDKSPMASVKLKDLIDQTVILNSFQDPWINNFPSCMTSLFVKIVLEKNVSIEIVDDIVNFEALLKLSSIEHEIEFDLHENSKLFYICKLKPNFSLEDNHAILQALGDSDSSLIKRLTFNLTGSNANAKIRIRSLAVSSQNFKFQTMQNHLHSNTSSCLCIKNVLFNDSKVECYNKIKVHENAHKSFSNQVNHNLIIGQNAHVISQPQLEIQNDHVKCKHGAVTKVIDEDQLFYLQSHGLDSRVAKKLIIRGFLS
jgi:hypothetical protein